MVRICSGRKQRSYTSFIKYKKYNLTVYEVVIKPLVLKDNCSHHAMEC